MDHAALRSPAALRSTRVPGAVLAVAVLAVAVLAGCTRSTTGPDGAQRPVDLTPYLTQQIDWQACPERDEYLESFPDQAECAAVDVPVDYFDQSSDRGTIEIAIIRISAEGESRGSLLVNPGGPGASGFDHVANNAQVLQRNLPGYDIIGFDPRGVERSAGFDCQTSFGLRLDYIEADFTPEDADEFEQTYDLADGYDESCRKANPVWGFLGTTSVARDVYVISNALGDEGINFYGISYGSVIGYEILRTYPDEIDRMILESTVDPSVEEVLAEQLAAFNDKIEELIVACAAPQYEFCGRGRSAEQVRAQFIEVLEGIEDPAITTLTNNGFPSEALVYYGMITPLYWEWTDEYTQWYLEAINALLNRKDATNFEFWGYLYNGYDANKRDFIHGDDISSVVTCLDESTSPQDTDIEQERSEDAAEIATIETKAPLLYAVGFSGAYLEDDRAYEPCSYAIEAYDDPSIPDPLPEPAPVVNPSATPVLVLGVSGDTATPYEWSKTIAGQLGMPLVTQDTNGHGVYSDTENTCTRDVVAGYLQSGAVPAADTTC